jgi:uncharacterized protein (DUF1501 family)
MKTFWNESIRRRSVLQLGAAGAVILAAPWTFRRQAFAQVASPHFLVVFQADGGWDPTQVFDVHDPNDPTDGVDVDVPGQPASVIRTVSGLTYVSNPVTRAPVDAFFDTWATRSAIVNGVNTRSTSHSQSRQLVATGYLDPTKADFAVMSAHHNGRDLPLPHLHVSGESFAGPFAGMSGRLGGAMGEAVHHNLMNDDELAISDVGEVYIRQALEEQALIDSGASRAIAGGMAQFDDGNERGDLLAEMANEVDINGNNGTQLATTLAQAFRNGLTTSATFSRFGGFDTHGDNTGQNGQFNDLFQFVDTFVARLLLEPGVGGGTMLDQTTVVVTSEFSRTPMLNGTNGKDHHPWASYLLIGKRVRPAVTVGRTDSNQEGMTVDFSTGLPSATGQVIDVANMVAGLMTLMGANAETYLPGVTPVTAFINA